MIPFLAPIIAAWRWFAGSRLGQALAAVLAILAFGWLQRRKGRSEGRAEIEDRAREAAVRREKERDQIESDIRPANAARELRERWTRDD